MHCSHSSRCQQPGNGGRSFNCGALQQQLQQHTIHALCSSALPPGLKRSSLGVRLRGQCASPGLQLMRLSHHASRSILSSGSSGSSTTMAAASGSQFAPLSSHSRCRPGPSLHRWLGPQNTSLQPSRCRTVARTVAGSEQQQQQVAESTESSSERSAQGGSNEAESSGQQEQQEQEQPYNILESLEEHQRYENNHPVLHDYRMKRLCYVGGGGMAWPARLHLSSLLTLTLTPPSSGLPSGLSLPTPSLAPSMQVCPRR